MAKRKLPVDFEKKVKQAPPPNGAGYPYSLSAKDLMDNFNYLLNVIPEGQQGDMLYHDGTSWVKLNSPSGSVTSALLHDGTRPYWTQTQDC